MLWDVVVPSALPELLNGVRTALRSAFILLVSSELIVSQQGFGYLIGYLGSTGAYEGMYRGGAHGRVPRLCRGPALSASHATAAPMAGLEDTASWRPRGRRHLRRSAASRRRVPQRRRRFFRFGGADRLGAFRPQRQGDGIHAAAVLRRRRAYLRRRHQRRSYGSTWD